MPYGTPSNPVAGTVITVAYQVANVLDPLRWLRAMTGNADPPGSNYVVVSSSTGATAWAKVPVDALAPGVALASLGFMPVNEAGDTMTGDLYVRSTIVAQSSGPNQGRFRCYQAGGGGYVEWTGDGANGMTLGPIDGSWLVQITPTELSHSARLHAVTLQIDGNAQVNGILSASTFAVASAVQVANLNASLHEGLTVAQIRAAAVPSGVIALWNAPSPPSGWVIDTSYAGRTVIGAGGGFTLVATGGATTHTHDIAHAHPQATTEAATGTTVSLGSTGTTAPATGHTHQFTAPSHGAGNLLSVAASSLPPYLVSNFIRKT